MTDHWKAVAVGITLASMVFAAGGGWYEVRQLRLDMEENSTRDQKLLETVSAMKEEQIIRGTELAKIGVLTDRIGVANDRMNTQQDYLNDLSEAQKDLIKGVSDLKAGTADRVYGIQIERWLLDFSKHNPDLKIPPLPPSS